MSKSLKLECVQITERNDWYAALKRTIAAAKEICNLAWSRTDSNNAFAKYKQYSEDLSDDDDKETDSPDASRDDDEEGRPEQTEQLKDPYNKRYAVTSSFTIQEFKEIDPMDEAVSQISEQDVIANQEQKNYAAAPTSKLLSPFGENGIKKKRSSGNVFRVSGANKTGNVAKVQETFSKVQRQESGGSSAQFVDQQRRKSNIVRRSNKDIESREKTVPQFTISLNNF